MALLLSFMLVGSGAVVFSYAFEVFNRGNSPWLIPSNLLTFLVIAAMTLLLYLFPDGKFVPSWTRFMAPVFAALMVAFLLPLPEALGQVAGLVAALAMITVGIYGRVHRYRHYSSPLERQQTKWVGLGLLALAITISFWFPSLMFFPPNQPSTARVYYLLTFLPVGAVVGLLLPVFVAISVLRDRLWDIDIYINRTAVYGPLSGVLMGLYAGSMRIFQGLFVRFTGEQSDLSILFSTVVLAGAFWPLRQRIQAVADRHFKESPDPSRGLKNFETQMRSVAELADVGHVTRRLLDETVAAFHAESGAVFLQQEAELRLTQTAGAWNGTATITVPLEHAEARFGDLALGPRHKGQGYTPQDYESLAGIARAAGQALSVSMRVR
ncbi:MAG: hypothetical protein HY531_03115 [Chloroflexi bacterium]|nr:hypothetical protein [Chloroflexota bacterium]